eukprot:7741836-Heterocapsa_arctica.AAC.1
MVKRNAVARLRVPPCPPYWLGSICGRPPYRLGSRHGHLIGSALTMFSESVYTTQQLRNSVHE